MNEEEVAQEDKIIYGFNADKQLARLSKAIKIIKRKIYLKICNDRKPDQRSILSIQDINNEPENVLDNSKKNTRTNREHDSGLQIHSEPLDILNKLDNNRSQIVPAVAETKGPVISLEIKRSKKESAQSKINGSKPNPFTSPKEKKIEKSSTPNQFIREPLSRRVTKKQKHNSIAEPLETHNNPLMVDIKSAEFQNDGSSSKEDAKVSNTSSERKKEEEDQVIQGKGTKKKPTSKHTPACEEIKISDPITPPPPKKDIQREYISPSEYGDDVHWHDPINDLSDPELQHYLRKGKGLGSHSGCKVEPSTVILPSGQTFSIRNLESDGTKAVSEKSCVKTITCRCKQKKCSNCLKCSKCSCACSLETQLEDVGAEYQASNGSEALIDNELLSHQLLYTHTNEKTLQWLNLPEALESENGHRNKSSIYDGVQIPQSNIIQPTKKRTEIPFMMKSDATEELLCHACNCDEDECVVNLCASMKRFLRSAVWETRNEDFYTSISCDVLIDLLADHSVNCSSTECNVPLCHQLRNDHKFSTLS